MARVKLCCGLCLPLCDVMSLLSDGEELELYEAVDTPSGVLPAFLEVGAIEAATVDAPRAIPLETAYFG